MFSARTDNNNLRAGEFLGQIISNFVVSYFRDRTVPRHANLRNIRRSVGFA